jgi:hypothetical protein
MDLTISEGLKSAVKWPLNGLKTAKFAPKTPVLDTFLTASML